MKSFLTYLIFSFLTLSSPLFGGELSQKSIPLGFSNNGTPDEEVVVDLTKVKSKFVVNKKFYGSQVSNFVPNPNPELVKNLRLGMVRVGGNLYDTYNWKNGLLYIPGDIPKKAISFEQFTRYFKEIGIDPIIQINLMGLALDGLESTSLGDGSGYGLSSLNGPEFAAQLVKHLNGELALGVENFSMGNEFEQWQDTHGTVFPWSEPLSADQYIDRYVSHALAMRKAQEEISGNSNDIRLWGPEISNGYYDWQTANMSVDCEYTDVWGQIACAYGPNKEYDHFLPYFLNRIKQIEVDPIINPNGYKLLDNLAFHYYPNFRTDIHDVKSIAEDDSGKQMVQKMLEHTEVWDNDSYTNTLDISSYRDFNPAILKRMNQWLKANYPDAKLVLSEYALDSFDTSFDYHPIIRPLYMADLIGKLVQNEVAFFGRAFLSTQAPYKIPWVLIDSGSGTDLFKMYQLFTNYFVGKNLEVHKGKTKNLEVNAYGLLEAKENSRSNVNLALINKAKVKKVVRVKLQMAQGLKVLADVTLAPWSASVLTIPSQGSELKQITYGALEMGISVAE